MSAPAPDLVIQMQRMGDLIMTFPLLAQLARKEPDRPLWVVAEPFFFEGLMPVAPKAVFFPPEAESRLASARFGKIINLSHRPEAARMAGSFTREKTIGPFARDGAGYINGSWQMYRASIVRNNRHNRLHWADLNCLDVFSLREFSRIRHSAPVRQAPAEGRIGLFVGASEPEKRPEAPFWGQLARHLLNKGFKPFFLGGPQDVGLGQAAERESGLKGVNLCGRFDLPGLAKAIGALELLITPDTGPMHLAAWLNVPTLNLSMGNVHAWETAPAAPGHHVLMPSLSCSGCWQCLRRSPVCRRAFLPARVAVAASLVLRRPASLASMRLPGLALLKTERDELGLFSLTRLDGRATGASEQVRDGLGSFWREWFLASLGELPDFRRAEERARALAAANPRLFRAFASASVSLGKKAASSLRPGRTSLSPGFWEAHPPFLRPIAGYLQVLLENGDYSAEARGRALELVANLAKCLL